MTANGVPSCGYLRKKQRPRIAGPSVQTSALPLDYGASASKAHQNGLLHQVRGTSKHLLIVS